MSPNKTSLIVPTLMITVGIGWLLTTLGVVPLVDWVWTLGLALVGVLTLGLDGIDKVTIAVGPFFLLAALLSVLRQTGRLSVNVEVPVLTIAAGVLLLVVRSSAIPAPRWLIDSGPSSRDDRP